MCGIVGLVSRGGDLEGRLRAMRDRLVHRGPDDAGLWVDGSVALGHRRLSILDLSEAGRQPLASPCGRYTLVYNGEIYNFRSLQAELSEFSFRGHCDSEVLAAAFTRWGIRGALERSLGMFALGVWDAQEKVLWLARDRLGQKPLYYGDTPEGWVFCSELKALPRLPLDREALGRYFQFRYVPAPYSVYQGIRKLLPGHLLGYRPDTGECDTQAYWSPAVRPTPFVGDAPAAVESLLGEAVLSQTIADVPLGTFLSGGIDSSLVLALLRQRHSGRLLTFTIGFEDPRYDESAQAARVAAHFGTEHQTLTVGEKDLLEAVPGLAAIYDEPFADSSQLPTYLIARLCCQHITVALSGDGGDELFAGYNRYTWGPRVWDRIRGIPLAARRAMATLARSVPQYLVEGLGRRMELRLPADKLNKLAHILPARSPDELYWRLVTDAPWPHGLPSGAPDPLPELPMVEAFMLEDTRHYLPDDIHAKVDRASMAVSLEVRAPFMDHRLYELAWSLPLELRMGKRILRDILARHLPAELFERPKMGFSIPVARWLTGPLRPWAEDMLAEDRLRRQGLVNVRAARRLWSDHLSGRRNWQHELWVLLMLSSWVG